MGMPPIVPAASASVLGTATNAFLSSAASSLGGGILGGLFGGDGINTMRSQLRYGLMREHKMYRYRNKFDWKMAEKRGLTPQEFYGSSAAGNSPTSGGGEMLGNQAQAQNMQEKQISAELGNRAADRAVSLEQTRMQTEAQKYTADKQFGASTYSTDKTFEGVMKKLSFDKQVYREVTRPQAARIAKKTVKEIDHLVNQIAINEPKFVKMLKIMTMGTDNTLGLAIQNMLDINVADVQQMKNLPADKRRLLIQGMMAAGSVVAKEMAGSQQTVNQYLDSFVNAMEKAAQGIGDLVNPGIEERPKTYGRFRNKRN